MTVRVAALVLVVVLLAPPARADADPISLAAYRDALTNARTQVEAARRSAGEERARAITAAISILNGVSEVRVADATYTALPHAPIELLLRAGDDASLERGSGMLQETVAAIGVASTPVVDPARARSALDAILVSADFRRSPDWRDALAEIIRTIAQLLFPDVRAPQITRLQVAILLSGIVTLLVVVIATNAARGLRAKITREAVRAAALASERRRAVDHLRNADDAMRQGRLREALRALFLAALAGLEERGGLRLDPALTDREILARAAGSPRADDLSSLVALYEPAWYGVREPTAAELERAGELARRIGA